MLVSPKVHEPYMNGAHMIVHRGWLRGWIMPIADRFNALTPHLPWTNRHGRLDGLRLVTFVAVLAPATWIVAELLTATMAAEPVERALHRAGDWALYILLATMAVTPLKRLLGWARLATVRRMLGVSVFAFAAAHLLLYAMDQAWDLAHVAREILSRFYLTIGLVVLVGFAVLAATSFDGAIRRLKRNWKRLHAMVYPLAALGLVHFFLQTRLDVSEPVLLSGLLVGLLLHRVTALMRMPAAVGILGVAVVSGVAAAGIEYTWFATMTGVPAERVVVSNLDFGFGLRPMWQVMLVLALPLPVRIAMRCGPHVIAALRRAPRPATSH